MQRVCLPDVTAIVQAAYNACPTQRCIGTIAVTESNVPSPESDADLYDDSSDEVVESVPAGGWTGSGDDLPELEELTPELAEEEAIRGDFMLRGAAILLAVLFGCGQIADSRVLVHIRSGDYMQEHGFLPPRTDVFSAPLEGQPTANVSWLFDHVVSLVWRLGGAPGLTIFKAALAALIAWLLARISVAGLPTWWNSICGVIALAACSSDLMPITDLMTLLGLILILRILHSAFEGQVDGLMWKAPLTVAIWANLDPRAWLGVFALLLFSAGRTFAKVPGDTRPAAAPGTLWAVTGVSAIALLINPFPLASALSFVQTYWTEYPALRALNPLDPSTVGLLDGRTEYYSLLNEQGWGGFEFGYVAALTVILFAGVAIVLSKDRRDAPWAFVLVGFVVLSVLAIHELAAAALAAAAAASTTGQRWYQKTFPQEYTVKPSEILFSRAGRAITVFSFAMLGFLLVTDRVPTRTPVGNGFTNDLETTMLALEEQLSELPEDARVLHSRVSLGDFLIWSDRRSYIDSRIRPFGAPTDESSTTQRFITLRRNMLEAALEAAEDAQSASTAGAAPTAADTAPSAATGTETTAVDAAAEDPPQEEPDLNEKLHRDLQEDGVTHAIAGLFPPRPHYRTLGALSSDANSWLLTSLGSSAAIFAYVHHTPETEEPAPFNIVERTFRDAEPVTDVRFEFAREKGFYDQYLYRTRPSVPEDLRVARHYLTMRETPATLMAAIRAANRLVTKDDQNAEGFYVLALAYSRLANWEAQVAQQTGGRFASDMRYMQIVMAARQAVTINPQHPGTWNLLYGVYTQRGRIDQALECLPKTLASMQRANVVGPDAVAGKQQAIERLREIEPKLRDAVSAVEVQLAEAMQNEFSEDPRELAMQKHSIAESVASTGHISAALGLLQENFEGLKDAPGIYARAETLRGQLLLETGALQQGYELFMQLDAMAQQNPDAESAVYPWTTMAFIAQLGLGDYANASDRMARYVGQLRTANSGPAVEMASLATLPLVASVETTLRSTAATRWPMPQLVQCRGRMQTAPNTQVEARFMQAMAELEGGFVDAARVNLQATFREYGETPFRPMAGVYLTLLQDDLQSFVTENTMNPWEDWSEPEFPNSEPDEAAAEQSNTDETATEEPSADASESAEPVTEDSTESATTESPTTEAAAGDPATEPAATEPAAEESADENESTSEAEAPEAPTDDEPAGEEEGPASEESPTEPPASDEPASEAGDDSSS